MEENQNQGSSLFEMEVDSAMKENLNTISKWSKFISIIGFVVAGLFVLGIASAGRRIIDAMDQLMPLAGSETIWVIVVVLVILGGLCVAWLYFLLQSSNLIRKG